MYLYKLIMTDTAGNGWNGAEYTIVTESANVHTGTLVDGSTGVDYICIKDGSHAFQLTERCVGAFSIHTNSTEKN